MKIQKSRGREVVGLSWRLTPVLLLLWAATAAAASSYSGPTGRITIQLQLSSDESLPVMTQVRVESVDGYSQTQTLIGQQVTFRGVPEGVLTVVVTRPGSEPVSLTTERREFFTIRLPRLSADRERLPEQGSSVVSVGSLLVDDEARDAVRRGLNALHQGAPGDALGHLDRALEIAPGFFDAHYNRSVALGLMNNFGEAETSIRQAVKLAPQRGVAHRQLGWVLLQARRHADAIDALRKCLSLSPGDAQALTLLGIAYERVGQHLLAAGFYQRAIQEQSDLSRAYLLLGRSQLALNRPEEARRHFEDYLDKWPDGPYAEEAKKLLEKIEGWEK